MDVRLKNMASDNQQEFPSSAWYVAVNLPLGLIWGIGVPVATGLRLDWPWWITTLVSIVWFIGNARVIDRYMPIATEPIIRKLHSLFGRSDNENSKPNKAS